MSNAQQLGQSDDEAGGLCYDDFADRGSRLNEPLASNHDPLQA